MYNVYLLSVIQMLLMQKVHFCLVSFTINKIAINHKTIVPT